MHRLTSNLLIYRNFPKDNILFQMAEICRDFQTGNFGKEELTARIYGQVNRLLDIATRYGFDHNLWHSYLAYLIAVNENPFSLTAEKTGAHEGSANNFARNDFKIFKKLFDYNFSRIESELDINCFSILSDYQAIEKKEQFYNKNVSEKVALLTRQIEECDHEYDIFRCVTNFYKKYGVGKFGLNKAFRVGEEDTQSEGMEDTRDWIQNPGNRRVELIPITNTLEVSFDDLIGYELQKQQLIENTEAFVEGRPSNNVLLFGDSGTGKSTSIKALLNEYYDRGLRMIEIYKHQFKDLSSIIAQIKNRNYRFIIYMDDLSFEEFEIEYKYLKAVIEGGLEIRPDNVLIYATSNRRHLIRETWSDRSDRSEDELHRSDTMQEKLSLVARFGVTINYSKPSQKEYFQIVHELAKKYKLRYTEQELDLLANQWELSHGGISGRTAQQFILSLAGQKGRKTAENQK